MWCRLRQDVSAEAENIVRVCREVLAPLIEHDRGELYLVYVDDDQLAIHLAGRCSGCPGVRFTTLGIIEPAIRSVAPRHRLTVTSGFRLPKGATRLPASDDRQPTDPDASASLSTFPAPAAPQD